MKIRYAQVIIDNRAYATDRLFTYKIRPDMLDLVQLGIRVVVPFGKGNRKIMGLIVGLTDKYNGRHNLKEIVDIIDEKPLISKDLIELSIWMSKEFLSPYIDSLQRVLPPGDFKKIKTQVTVSETAYNYKGKLNSLEERILNFLLEKKKEVELENLKQIFGTGYLKNLRSLEEKSLIQMELEIGTSINKKYERYIVLDKKDLSYKELISVIGKRSYKQREIVDYLIDKAPLPTRQLMKDVNTSLSTVRALEKKGLIKIYNKEVYRSPIKKNIKNYNKPVLSKEQKYCIDTIMARINNKDKRNQFLIHGVTGSGKTEIYLRLAEEMIKLNKDTIVLVPEISLTPQTIERFGGRFGDNVAVLHSRLSYGERFDQWRKIKEGKVKIVVGARSAIFAPFKNLGLVIIDEEHESTYKSSMNPKYCALKVAKKRCEQFNAYLVKGSATPSIESYYEWEQGQVELISLKERINKKSLPEVEVVDMRKELQKGNNSIFSYKLYKAIERNIEKGQQTILFLNRRGYSTFVSCRECGYVVKCNSCDISMTYYMRENKLKCHYCGLAVNPPSICPTCKSKYIKYFGIGTEKVEAYTKEIFPQARVKRMDLDTTSRKGSHENILKAMENQEIDILIGTQMIGKGLDFGNVTLVGVITADTSLNLPDFRASERTFQLITQVAGRAGRGEHKGKVIVQTYNPDHYSIQGAKNHDFIDFYNKEILVRRTFNYPPFTNIISIIIYGENKYKVTRVANNITSYIKEYMYTCGLAQLLGNLRGPNPAPLEKIKNNYRFQVLIKSPDEYLGKLKDIIEWVCIENTKEIDFTGIKLNIDINPNSIL